MRALKVSFVSISLFLTVAFLQGQNYSPSPGAAQILKLVSSGVSNDIILSFILTDRAPLRLDADDIIGLKNAQVSNDVLVAAIGHDAQLTPLPVSAPSGPVPTPPVQTQAAPQVQTVVVPQTDYDEDYPWTGPAYYGPSFGFSLDFGPHHRWHDGDYHNYGWHDGDHHKFH
jgi:hypothetical protein